ncbi:RnfABCDGE type electron transport complex subunit B [Teredinibacter turnerae]|uniref:RnfABCDGE type electron transport complex subunit B n=1 Tax=Teredinibacter turnerae TaxID=2426 RepID=UPI0003A38CDB|nr:RnfABCDGE type electron transport complex subunit B [Teredinibacter turnerae]
MVLAILAITVLGAGLGLLLGIAGKVFAVEEENPLVKEIEDILPGSQCGQCGFPGCSPAAKAVVDGEIGVNFCPPGGRALVEDLAKLLDIDPNSVGEVAKPLVAAINEELCVGCTKCFKACPTDAVVGANGQIHVVISSACTGCKKCQEACPENCISMSPEEDSLNTWHWPKPHAA